MYIPLIKMFLSHSNNFTDFVVKFSATSVILTEKQPHFFFARCVLHYADESFREINGLTTFFILALQLQGILMCERIFRQFDEFLSNSSSLAFNDLTEFRMLEQKSMVYKQHSFLSLCDAILLQLVLGNTYLNIIFDLRAFKNQ